MGRWDLDDVEPNTEAYRREAAERRHIIDSCPFDVYSSSTNPRYAYPYRLMSYWEARVSVAESGEEIIIDSGYRRFGDLDQILEAVADTGADRFLPPDVTPHFDIYDHVKPADRAREIWEFGQRAEEENVDAEMLVPVHRPIDENMDELEGFRTDDGSSVNLLERFGGVAVGLKGVSVSERVRILSEIERRTSPGTHVHALSPGTEIEMIAFLRENPHLLDSLDVSTPETAPANNKIPDNRWKQHRFRNDGPRSWFPTGTDITTIRAMTSVRILLQLNYMLSDLCDDSEFEGVRSTAEQIQEGENLGLQHTWTSFVREVVE